MIDYKGKSGEAWGRIRWIMSEVMSYTTRSKHAINHCFSPISLYQKHLQLLTKAYNRHIKGIALAYNYLGFHLFPSPISLYLVYNPCKPFIHNLSPFLCTQLTHFSVTFPSLCFQIPHFSVIFLSPCFLLTQTFSQVTAVTR